MSALEVIRVLDAVVALAASAGVSIARYQELREQSGGSLTPEQVEQLARESDEAVGRL